MKAKSKKKKKNERKQENKYYILIADRPYIEKLSAKKIN